MAGATDPTRIPAEIESALSDAPEFLGTLRIRHQARQMSAGQVPANFLLPDELSQFERTQLKDAFKVVAEMQDAVGQRYQVGRF